MKYKKKRKNLELAQMWWDKQPERFKAATTRSGSIKQRIIGGSK